MIVYILLNVTVFTDMAYIFHNTEHGSSPYNKYQDILIYSQQSRCISRAITTTEDLDIVWIEHVANKRNKDKKKLLKLWPLK